MFNRIKIVQHNVNRDRIASHQLQVACKKRKIDYLLVQEPHVVCGRVYAFECFRSHISVEAGAAIIALSNRFQTIKLSTFSSSHTVDVKVNYGKGRKDHMVLVSAYFKYNSPTISHIERLDQILASENKTVICTDTNGPSTRWHSIARNPRVRIIEEFIDKHGLSVHNTSDQMNTFCRRDGRTSNIVVTLTTANLADKLGIGP